jgi:hypothetical protein
MLLEKLAESEGKDLFDKFFICRDPFDKIEISRIFLIMIESTGCDFNIFL